MYRIIFIIVITLAIAMGLLVGTLNSDMVSVDLLWVQLEWPLGLLVLSALSAGLFLGLGLAWIFTILPLRVQLRKLRNARVSGSSGMLNNING
ncbi:MAG: LapA family protein [Proteobacteria bacterium]|nr:LapA family protein [Pseudomonadota bacterium]